MPLACPVGFSVAELLALPPPTNELARIFYPIRGRQTRIRFRLQFEAECLMSETPNPVADRLRAGSNARLACAPDQDQLFWI